MSSSYSTYSRSPSPAKPAGQASRPVTARANARADSDSYSYSSSSPEPERGRGPARQTAVLRVRNLTRNVGVEHLREIFGLYGKIMSVELAIDQAVGLSKGYAFVEFATARLAEDAIHHMDGGEIDSQRVSPAPQARPAVEPTVQARSVLQPSSAAIPLSPTQLGEALTAPALCVTAVPPVALPLARDAEEPAQDPEEPTAQEPAAAKLTPQESAASQPTPPEPCSQEPAPPWGEAASGLAEQPERLTLA